MNPYFGVPMTAEQYASEWKENSKLFSENGHYDWMASCLGQPATILEIGCGAGGSTFSLAKVAERVIAVETNSTLANEAAKYLNDMGVLAEVVDVEVVQGPIRIGTCKVTIVVCDVFDGRLCNALSLIEVDAICCWLIGANPGLIASHLGRSLESFSGAEMPEYRERVHSRVYTIGRLLLKAGGIVHITDRMMLRSWSEKDLARSELTRRHIELSNGGYQIAKESAFLRRFDKSFAASRILYITAPGVGNSSVSAISSIRAKKIN